MNSDFLGPLFNAKRIVFALGSNEGNVALCFAAADDAIEYRKLNAVLFASECVFDSQLPTICSSEITYWNFLAYLIAPPIPPACGNNSLESRLPKAAANERCDHQNKKHTDKAC